MIVRAMNVSDSATRWQSILYRFKNRWVDWLNIDALSSCMLHPEHKFCAVCYLPSVIADVVHFLAARIQEVTCRLLST